MNKQEPIQSKDLHIGCKNCSTAALVAPLDLPIAVGFGDAYVTKDGKEVYNGEADYQAGKEPKTIMYFEILARQEPGADWRVVFYRPMHGETYQRHNKDRWVCIESNQGFA